ncbi:hypothetical protein EA187_01265 [Lujinxingia sediminis]|uniref:TonB C-terminal domain-containing protein n=1 Tax=Lujinxingia sediminis TaxID=2480984 RepID=A0ABY0CWZ0_9DELT|nr:hypothetical protein [Lujinxingia sediminis]RVU48096.1 hypothetical protein EA187_01265 [Lujinxingia sediminis]
MQPRTSQIATQVAAMAMSFAVGLLLGPRLCAPPPAEIEAPAPCPKAQTRIVERCPEEPPPAPTKPAPAKPVKPSRARPVKSDPHLPASPPPTSAEDRQRLLAWARDQSISLQGCTRDPGTTYRLSVTLTLDESRSINDVSLNAGPDALNESLRRCLETRIADWTLPDDLAPAHRRLVFGLTL